MKSGGSFRSPLLFFSFLFFSFFLKNLIPFPGPRTFCTFLTAGLLPRTPLNEISVQAVAKSQREVKMDTHRICFTVAKLAMLFQCIVSISGNWGPREDCLLAVT